MEIIFGLLPVSIVIALLGLAAYICTVKSGQLDDLDTPPRRMLFDDKPDSDPKK
ncbi:MAG: cbb3-type cytochrome oxidase assembly protein CcoS [Bdellovibrionales bacterium]|nr:cbb3-type cytochrome oxidase assembly protein CcoS [Bdellovibrionales bacterium]